MRLLFATFAMGVLSAVIPLINMEAYIAGIAALLGDINIWLVALVAGIGQAIGKIPWYEVSRRSMDWSLPARSGAPPCCWTCSSAGNAFRRTFPSSASARSSSGRTCR